MTKHALVRRDALKLMLAGAAVTLTAGCDSLPRVQTGGTTDGSELALRVRQALKDNPFTSQMTFDIKTKGDDEVVIHGFVSNRNDISNVEMVASQVDGVRHAVVDLFLRN